MDRHDRGFRQGLGVARQGVVDAGAAKGLEAAVVRATDQVCVVSSDAVEQILDDGHGQALPNRVAENDRERRPSRTGKGQTDRGLLNPRHDLQGREPD